MKFQFASALGISLYEFPQAISHAKIRTRNLTAASYPLKILHFFKTYWPESFGGIERTIHGIAEGLKDEGVETTVLTLSQSPSHAVLDQDGIKVVQLKQNFQFASTGVSFSAVRQLRNLAEQHDVVHYHSPWPFMDFTHFLARHSRPTLLTYHADPIGNSLLVTGYRPLLKQYLKSVDRIVATSPHYLKSSAFLRGVHEKVSIVPIGLPNQAGEEPDPTLVQKLKDEHGENFFLFVGVLRHYKGLEHLLEAARHTNAKILIAGDGKRRGVYEKRCAEQKLDNVKFLGHIDEAEKKALLSLCLAFVFPSHTRAEAFGVSLVEASRAGKAMITCDLGTGTSFVNQDGETGLVVEPSNPRALANAINRFVADPGLAIQAGNQARLRYEEFLTQEKMAGSYLSIYRGLCSNG